MLIDTRLGRLFVDDRGKGEPIVLWPSLLTDGGMWRFQIPTLAERWRVITIDPPGHGRSARVEAPFTLEDCADAAVEVMDALGVEQTHFGGLSWGGMTGLRIALRHPGRLRSLALIDTNADRETPKKIPAYRAMMAIARVLGPNVPPLLDRVEAIYFTRASRRHRREIVDDFRAHVASREITSLRYCLDAVIFQRGDIRDRLSTLEVPTLVIVGAKDIATPIDRSSDIASRIPGAELVIVPEAAHLSALEAPERITAELVRFFERNARAHGSSGASMRRRSRTGSGP